MDVYGLVRWFEYLDNGLMLCNHTDGLALIDPRTDSVLVDSSLAAGAVYAVTHTGDGEKVYLVRKDRLEVRSSSSLSLLDTIVWPYFDPVDMATTLVYSDSTHKLYWFVWSGLEDDSVLAIDATRDTVAARMGSPELYHAEDGVCLDHTGRYLFCSSPFDSSLRVYDTRLDSLVGILWHLPYPFAVAASPEQHCIYVGCQDVILVYPDAPPGICEEPATSTSPKLPPQTVVRNALFLPEARGLKLQAANMLDISGRKVLDLKPGANDVRHLVPGVYFVREASGVERAASRVTKVVVTR